MTVLLVTGSRHGHPHVRAVLDRWVAKFGEPENVVLGDALGVDTQALDWAAERAYRHEVIGAEWAEFGSRAGPRRNAEMVKFAKGYAWSSGTVAHCVGFPVGGSLGTRGCMALAVAGNIHVFEVDTTGRVRRVYEPPS